MNKGIIPAFFVLFCVTFAGALPQATCAYSTKIQPALCGRLDSVTADQLVPVNITLYEDVIHVPLCEDRLNPPPDSIKCGDLYADSEAAYWARHKSEVLRIFSQCPVWDTATLSHRLDSTDFKVTIYYSGLATKQTILTLASESLVRLLDLGFYFRLPDSVLQATSFPFDTVLVGHFSMNDSGLVKFDSSEIMISRYNLPLFFWRTPDLLWFPEYFSWDFQTNPKENTNLIKYPTQGFKYLITSCECHGAGGPSCSSWLKLDTAGYKNFEYRLRTVTSFLYMKVLDGSTPDSIKLRFNTSSFLPAGTVRRPEAGHGKNKGLFSFRQILEGLKSGKFNNNAAVTVYSMNGKNITTDVMKGNVSGRNGIVVLKIMENGRSYYFKQVLAR